jgi:hypothetical protein
MCWSLHEVNSPVNSSREVCFIQAVAASDRVSIVAMNFCMAAQFLQVYDFIESSVQLLTLVVLTLSSRREISSIIPTPCSRIPFEKLIVTQLDKKFPTSYRTRKFFAVLNLERTNPVHNLTDCVLILSSSRSPPPSGVITSAMYSEGVVPISPQTQIFLTSFSWCSSVPPGNNSDSTSN